MLFLCERASVNNNSYRTGEESPHPRAFKTKHEGQKVWAIQLDTFQELLDAMKQSQDWQVIVSQQLEGPAEHPSVMFYDDYVE